MWSKLFIFQKYKFYRISESIQKNLFNYVVYYEESLKDGDDYLKGEKQKGNWHSILIHFCLLTCLPAFSGKETAFLFVITRWFSIAVL